MSNSKPTVWYHSNRYNAQAACPHCEGVIRHEAWCSVVNQLVWYAFQVVTDPTRMSVGDTLILHSLGVSWAENQAAPATANSRA